MTVPEDGGGRIDRVLAAQVPALSRSRLKALILAGHVTAAGRTVRDPAAAVNSGDIITVTLPEAEPAKPAPEAMALDIVYEDDALIVLNKPAGLVVHPAAGHTSGTLVNALIAHCGASLSGVGGVARPGIVHRLDKDTSGLLVAAKNERAMASLAKQFANHTIERAYHAVVWGAPRAGEGVVEGSIGRSPFDRKRMAVLRGGGKVARTRYRLVEAFGDPDRPFASLIECRLETGRTHQIRVHLTHIGHPLIGDASYGRSRQPPRAKTTAQEVAFAEASNFPRQALHAYILGFQHHTLHKTMRFTSSWPADMVSLISALRSLKKGG